MGEAEAALLIQRVWKGVCARRRFSELFFDALLVHLKEEAAAKGLEAAEKEAADYPSRSPQKPDKGLELEEALEEVHGSHYQHHKNPSTESLPKLLNNAEAMSPSRSTSNDAGGSSRSGGTGGGGSNNASASIELAAFEYTEFNEEMAAGMSVETLQELVGVLTRMVVARNNELISLLQRRDELSNEREYRQAMIAQLLKQVSKSRHVKGFQLGSAPRRPAEPNS